MKVYVVYCVSHTDCYKRADSSARVLEVFQDREAAYELAATRQQAETEEYYEYFSPEERKSNQWPEHEVPEKEKAFYEELKACPSARERLAHCRESLPE